MILPNVWRWYCQMFEDDIAKMFADDTAKCLKMILPNVWYCQMFKDDIAKCLNMILPNVWRWYCQMFEYDIAKCLKMILPNVWRWYCQMFEDDIAKANLLIWSTIFRCRISTISMSLAIKHFAFHMSHATRKQVFGGFQPGKTQTGLLSYRD